MVTSQLAATLHEGQYSWAWRGRSSTNLPGARAYGDDQYAIDQGLIITLKPGHLALIVFHHQLGNPDKGDSSGTVQGPSSQLDNDEGRARNPQC